MKKLKKYLKLIDDYNRNFGFEEEMIKDFIDYVEKDSYDSNEFANLWVNIISERDDLNFIEIGDNLQDIIKREVEDEFFHYNEFNFDITGLINQGIFAYIHKMVFVILCEEDLI